MFCFRLNIKSVVFAFAFIALFGYTDVCAKSSTVDVLLDSLRATIEARDAFVAEKELAINAARDFLHAGDSISDEEMYRVNSILYEHYHKYQVDSALSCIDRAYDAAMRLGSSEKSMTAKLKKSLELSMCSRFIEAQNILNGIDAAPLDTAGKLLYYEAGACFLEFYSASCRTFGFDATAYRDSLFRLNRPESYSHRVSVAVKVAENDSVEGERLFRELMNDYGPESAEYAMLTNQYAGASMMWGKRERALEYYIRSAISDIRKCTRETLSLQSVAALRFEDGYYRDAYNFTMVTISDIQKSGISFRGSAIYNNYTIISSALREEERRAHKSLVWLLAVSVLSVLILIAVAVCLYRQMQRNIRIKRELAQSNLNLNEAIAKLNSINELLNEKNTLLYENNLAKQSYIAEFFDVCFHYIDKVEQTQNALYKLAMSRSFAELTRRLQSDDTVSEETAELYQRFDSIFLKLYPTFVEDLNRLLRDDERMKVPTGSLLNRELRIYALMRLGIVDSGKIAFFLRCSTSTVYNYRTRMRNRAVDRENFEENIMSIKASHDV